MLPSPIGHQSWMALPRCPEGLLLIRQNGKRATVLLKGQRIEKRQQPGRAGTEAMHHRAGKGLLRGPHIQYQRRHIALAHRSHRAAQARFGPPVRRRGLTPLVQAGGIGGRRLPDASAVRVRKLVPQQREGLFALWRQIEHAFQRTAARPAADNRAGTPSAPAPPQRARADRMWPCPAPGGTEAAAACFPRPRRGVWAKETASYPPQISWRRFSPRAP